MHSPNAGQDRLTGGVLVLLAVGCGIALQLFLVRYALMLVAPGAGFLTLVGHIAGWGLGLGVARSAPFWLRRPAVPASLAAGLGWLGVAGATSGALAAGGALAAFGLTAVASGTLTGLSIAWALAACRSPAVALAGDLAGVALGALGHVLLTASFPRAPSPAFWLALLALSAIRAHTLVPLVTVGLAAVLLVPLDQVSRLASADTPLGRALRAGGLDAWQGAFHDVDGRVDAVANAAHGGVALYINTGTQAQTPAPTRDRVTRGVIELVEPRSALVLGAGGLADVATLLDGGAERVVAVERSEAVLTAARAVSAPARALFSDPRVEVIRAEGRRFPATRPEKFDLVLLPLAYAGLGVSPTALMFYPSYLFSVEGVMAQAESTTPEGAACFILPLHQLRDRMLATLGAVAERRSLRETLPQRLWVAENPHPGAYAQVVCWAPHAPLRGDGGDSGLIVLHHPGQPPSAALRARLDGDATLPPAWDRRPYFFDLHSLRPGGAGLPPQVASLLFCSPLGLAFIWMVLWRRRHAGRASDAPPASQLAIAALTGFAFPALEYLVLALARVSGFSEGVAYALVSVSFAAAGFAGMGAWGSPPARALLGAAVMAGAGVFFAADGVSWLFAIGPRVAGLVVGPILMLGVMTAGAAPFTALFRSPRAGPAASPEVRPLFLASALGTLSAVAPVLLVELRWGAPGCALAAGAAYTLAFVVSAAAGSRSSRRVG